MAMKPPVVFVIAPQGAGKSHHAAALADMFGCTSIMDEWDGCAEVEPGALVLSNYFPAECARAWPGCPMPAANDSESPPADAPEEG